MNKLLSPSNMGLLVALLALTGCVVQAPPPRVVYAAPVPVVAYVPLPPQPVISVYIEPLLIQPPPVVIGWAPPPMLVEAPPFIPFEGAIWTGGYWVWHGDWVWSAGRWAPPPQPGYGWVHPYYENRSGVVIFIGGHWAAPGVVFVPPPPTLSLTVAIALPGVVPGPRPIGPVGVFVPAPPGSRPGLIVPAPIGTPPAVVIGAPPVTNVGMRIQSRVDNNSNNTTVNNTRVTNITNVTNVTIVAPASATASGRAFEAQVPNQAHLAAAQTPVVHATAPTPASTRPMAAFSADRPSALLPPPQAVQMRPASAVTAPAPARPPVTATTVPAPAPAPAPVTSSPPKPERVMAAPTARPPAPAASAAAPPARPQQAQKAQADKAAVQATKQQQAEAAKAKAAKEKPAKHDEHEREHKQE